MTMWFCSHDKLMGADCQECRPAEVPAAGDSAELTAHRETVANCDCVCAEAGQALLRMLEETNVRMLRDEERVENAERAWNAALTERDELRAKLADEQGRSNHYADALAETEAMRIDTKEKLAEAEKFGEYQKLRVAEESRRADANFASWRNADKRAEAAEDRAAKVSLENDSLRAIIEEHGVEWGLP